MIYLNIKMERTERDKYPIKCRQRTLLNIGLKPLGSGENQYF